MFSRIEAPLPEEAPEHSITGTLNRLEQCPLPLSDIRVAESREIPGSSWEALTYVQIEDEAPLQLRIYNQNTDVELFGLHIELGQLSPPVLEEVRRCRQSIGIEAHIADSSPLDRYHAQLKVLSWLAPEAPAVLDVSAADVRPASWLREVANSNVPPHPNALYSIHCVERQKESTVWLHTHGLERCGRSELEMLDIPREAVYEMSLILNATAHMLLDGGDPKPGEHIFPARGMPLVALPLEDAFRHVRRRCHGGPSDRDQLHLEATRRVLLAPSTRKRDLLLGRKFQSPKIYQNLFSSHPAFYVTDLQTYRMASLAQERFGRFRALFNQFSDHPAFRFLVKLGFDTASSQGHNREHLWFDIHQLLSENKIDATCLNQPHDVPTLEEGLRGTWPLSLMTDFTVLSPSGQTSPEHIASLEAIIKCPNTLEEWRRLADTLEA